MIDLQTSQVLKLTVKGDHIRDGGIEFESASRFNPGDAVGM